MGFFSRLFGICRTPAPGDPGCWTCEDGKVTVDLARAPELQEAGGALRLEGGNLPLRVLVFKGEDGEFHAFHNQCTHGGRRLDPLPGQSLVECCSVGRSRFQYDGQLVSGSAEKAAAVLPLHTAEGRLVVDVPTAGS